MTMALSFQSIQFDVVNQNNQPWIRANQIGLALDYGKRGGQVDPTLAASSIRKIYDRHAEEFTDDMTATPKTVVPGDPGNDVAW